MEYPSSTSYFPAKPLTIMQNISRGLAEVTTTILIPAVCGGCAAMGLFLNPLSPMGAILLASAGIGAIFALATRLYAIHRYRKQQEEFFALRECYRQSREILNSLARYTDLAGPDGRPMDAGCAAAADIQPASALEMEGDNRAMNLENGAGPFNETPQKSDNIDGEEPDLAVQPVQVGGPFSTGNEDVSAVRGVSKTRSDSCITFRSPLSEDGLPADFADGADCRLEKKSGSMNESLLTADSLSIAEIDEAEENGEKTSPVQVPADKPAIDTIDGANLWNLAYSGLENALYYFSYLIPGPGPS